MPSSIPRNPPVCSFTPFLIGSLTLFINKPVYSRHLIIFMVSLIPSLEIINVIVPDQKNFIWISASVADVDAGTLNGIKTVLANALRFHH